MFELFNHRSGRWLVSLLAWPVLTLTMGGQEQVSRAATGQKITLLDALRFPAIEYLFWALACPLLFDLASAYPIGRDHRKRNASVLLAWSLVVVVLHAACRAPLHDFVYPASRFQQGPPNLAAAFKFYFVGNIGSDLWMFATIVAVAHLALYHNRYRERVRQLDRAQL